jgi:hypothetical protein
MNSINWKQLKKMANLIMECQDSGRLDAQGGYPSQWTIFANHIIIATVDHNEAPDLTIEYLPEWIQDNWYWIAEDYEEGLKPEEILARIERE